MSGQLIRVLAQTQGHRDTGTRIGHFQDMSRTGATKKVAGVDIGGSSKGIGIDGVRTGVNSVLESCHNA